MKIKYDYNWKQYQGGNVAEPLKSSSKYHTTVGSWSGAIETPPPPDKSWIDIKTKALDGVTLYEWYNNYVDYCRAVHKYLLDYHKEHKEYPILKIVRRSAYNGTGIYMNSYVSFDGVDTYGDTYANGVIFHKTLRQPYVITFDALRLCEPEEEAEAREILKEHEKNKNKLKVVIDGNTVSVNDFFNVQKTKFNFGKAPYCCGMSEAGIFSLNNKDDDVDMMTKAVIDFVAYHKNSRIAGCIVANFVQTASQSKMQSSNWFKAFRKAGFEIIGKPFENLGHRGNILVSLYYQHNNMEYNYE